MKMRANILFVIFTGIHVLPNIEIFPNIEILHATYFHRFLFFLSRSSHPFQCGLFTSLQCYF